MVVVCVCEPNVPVMVSVLVPGVAFEATVKRISLLDVAGFGWKVAVTPLGRPEMERLTLFENPYCPWT